MDRAMRGPRNKGGRINRNKGLPVAARKLLVEKANKRTELLSMCEGQPLTHTAADEEYSVEHITAPKASDDIKAWVLSLTRDNVKELYIDSGWGWSDEEKGNELHHNKAQYLLVRKSSTKDLVAFTHFRFDMDYGSHVLYCYELQVAKDLQSSGIGTWVMNLLLSMATENKMSKVVLTVGRNNPRALKFYFELGYRVDETSPSTLKDVNSGSYLILSKSCKEDKENKKSN